MRWTGTIKENSVTDQVVSTFDWTATILSLARGKADPNYPLDGMDMTPVFRNPKKETARTLYWRISQRRDNKAMRDGIWKWLKDEKGNDYLFDLSTDPTEKTNLNEKYPDILNNLKSKYAKWEETMLKPIPLGG